MGIGSMKCGIIYRGGRMAELVYAFDLKSNGAIRTGSSPVPATIFTA